MAKPAEIHNARSHNVSERCTTQALQ